MKHEENGAAIAVIAILMSAYIASAAWSAAIQDTARDVYYAYAIRHALWLPTEGPVLGGAIHLSALWFYLLSLPLFVNDSWLSVALFAAAISSLKFPLAFAVGRRALDARFGLLWSCALALPGWNTLEQLIFFNPNPAAACMLGALLLWMRLREAPSIPIAFGLGLLMAVSLHIHPTCAPMLALGAHVLSRKEKRSSIAVAMAAGFALPLLPYVAHELATGSPDAAGAGRYIRDQVNVTQLLAGPALLLSMFAGGTQAIVGYLWRPPLAVSIACGAAAGLLAALSSIALIKGSQPRRIWIALASSTLLLAAFAAALRPTTPWYFTYATLAFVAGLQALGACALLRRASYKLVITTCAVVVVIQLSVSTQVAGRVHSGEGQLSSRILDVKEWRGRQVYSDTWFPAIGRDDLGSLLCASRGVTLHGQLAFIEDRSVGADALFSCANSSHISLMGSGATHHWVGMSRGFWSKLGASPQCWAGSLGLVRPSKVAWPLHGIPIADGRAYFPREIARNSPREHALRFIAPRNEALIISNPLSGYEGLQDLRVSVDENEVVPIASNDLSWLFIQNGKDGNTTWTVTFKASTPEHIDVVLFTVPKKSGSDVMTCSKTLALKIQNDATSHPWTSR